MKASLVIPTYNRADILALTLDHLVQQDLPADEFEVLIADDGSTDDTPAVVDSYRDRLTLRYTWQQDRGFRAAAARNLAAEQATAPLLVFLDSGEMPTRGFVSGHVRAHNRPGLAVIGLMYGYDKRESDERLSEEDLTYGPDELVARLIAGRRKLDIREREFRAVDDDLSRCAAPYAYFWTCNVSVPTDDFRRVGGFDPSYVGWGGEDTELGRRLHDAGLRLTVTRDANVVEFPHRRDRTEISASQRHNADKSWRLHPDPAMELVTILKFDRVHRRLAELTSVLPVVGGTPGHVITEAPAVVFGASALPAAPGAIRVIDPDPRAAQGRVPFVNGFGFRTGLDDQAVAVAVIGAPVGDYPEWARALVYAEAHRIADQVIDLTGVAAPHTPCPDELLFPDQLRTLQGVA